MPDIIRSTRDIIRENDFQDVITLVKGKLEDVEDLHDKKFDVLVSDRVDGIFSALQRNAEIGNCC